MDSEFIEKVKRIKKFWQQLENAGTNKWMTKNASSFEINRIIHNFQRIIWKVNFQQIVRLNVLGKSVWNAGIGRE